MSRRPAVHCETATSLRTLLPPHARGAIARGCHWSCIRPGHGAARCAGYVGWVGCYARGGATRRPRVAEPSCGVCGQCTYDAREGAQLRLPRVSRRPMMAASRFVRNVSLRPGTHNGQRRAFVMYGPKQKHSAAASRLEELCSALHLGRPRGSARGVITQYGPLYVIGRARGYGDSDVQAKTKSRRARVLSQRTNLQATARAQR